MSKIGKILPAWIILLTVFCGVSFPNGGEINHLIFFLQDGTKLNGFLSLSPGYRRGEKSPAILLIPGGKGTRKEKPWARARNFLDRKEIQEHLRARYVVFSVEYQSEYFGDPKEIESLAAALKTLAARPEVNRDRIAAVGNSHGGYLAMMCAVHPDITSKPRAVVSVSGVVDVATFVEHMQREENTRFGFMPQESFYYATRKVTQALGWPPDRDARTQENYRRRSVLTYIKDLQAPLLVIHGTVDEVVPYSQAQMLRQALEKDRKTFDFLEVPTTQKMRGHLIFNHSQAVWSKIEVFLGKYLPH